MNLSPSTIRMPASKPEIREALRRIYDEAGADPPNVNRAWDLVKLKMLHAQRSRVREVLDENEFACRRREPGKKEISRAGIVPANVAPQM